jgi:hypothetical protein
VVMADDGGMNTAPSWISKRRELGDPRRRVRPFPGLTGDINRQVG